MQKKTAFRQALVCRAFAFACPAALATLTLAGCATDGAVKPSTQSALVNVCDEAQIAVTLASFYRDKMTDREASIYQAAQIAVPKFCSPSALAADLTPAALASNLQALQDTITQLDAIDGAVPATVTK